MTQCPLQHRPSASRRLLTLLSVAGVLTAVQPLAQPASAQDFVLHVEPAAALWLDTPQSDRFSPGFYGAVRPSIALNEVLSLQLGYAFIWMPAGDGFENGGSGHLGALGFRVRPFGTLGDPADNLGGLFIDANANYVRTGDLDRFGFDAGLGYGFQVASNFAIGPVVRYTQIMQSQGEPGIDDNDAQIISLGLNLTFGPSYTPPPPKPEPCAETQSCPPVEPCVQEPPPPVVPPEPVPCTCIDTDTDGVCDVDDRCPTQPGAKDTFGCPVDPCTGQALVVQVHFAFDSAKLPARKKNEPQTMDPVLDAVSAAIAKDPTCRVCIIGHTSDEGTDKYNQRLSTQRANAVQKYMGSNGLNRGRIPTIGMGERCPVSPSGNQQHNRRVEFHRLKEGESCHTECATNP
jgi:outer membrane protein OmpA-like peptidoglycan-associated protein